MANELQTKLDAILNDKNTNLLPENLKAGITCLGVEGEFEEKIKLFETVEDMQNDINPVENVLALVYNKALDKIQLNTILKNMYAPEKIVLDEPVTSSDSTTIRVTLNNASYPQIYISYNASNVNISYYSDDYSDRFDAGYSSSDGLIYVREYSDGTISDDAYWFTNPGTITKISNDNDEDIDISSVPTAFIGTININYDDVYQYKTSTDDEHTLAIKKLTYNTDESKVVSSETALVRVPLLKAFGPSIIKNAPDLKWGIIFKNDNDEYLISTGGGFTAAYVYKNGIWYTCSLDGMSRPSYHAILDMDTLTCSEQIENRIDIELTPTSSVTRNYMSLEGYYPICSIEINDEGTMLFPSYESIDGYYMTDTESYDFYFNSRDEKNFGHISYTGYHRLNKNSTLCYPYELLPGVSAYGKYGLITGTDLIYNKLALHDAVNKYTDAPLIYGSADAGGKKIAYSNNITIEQFINSKFTELKLPIDFQYIGNSEIKYGPYFYNYNSDTSQLTVWLYDWDGKLISEYTTTSSSNYPAFNIFDNIVSFTTYTKPTNETYSHTVHIFDSDTSTWTTKTLISNTKYCRFEYYINNNDIYWISYYEAYGTRTKNTSGLYKNETKLCDITKNNTYDEYEFMYMDNDYLYFFRHYDNKKIVMFSFKLSDNTVNTLTTDNIERATSDSTGQYLICEYVIGDTSPAKLSKFENGNITYIDTAAADRMAVWSTGVTRDNFDIYQIDSKYYAFSRWSSSLSNNIFIDLANNIERPLLNISSGVPLIFNPMDNRYHGVIEYGDMLYMVTARPDILFVDTGSHTLIPTNNTLNSSLPNAYIAINTDYEEYEEINTIAEDVLGGVANG